MFTRLSLLVLWDQELRVGLHGVVLISLDRQGRSLERLMWIVHKWGDGKRQVKCKGRSIVRQGRENIKQANCQTDMDRQADKYQARRSQIPSKKYFDD